jgi:glucosylceramidase
MLAAPSFFVRTVLASIVAAMAITSSGLASPTSVVSTADAPWSVAPLPAAGGNPPPADAAVIVIDRTAVRQPIDGFGGCFNEQGWAVLNLLAPADRERVLRALFDPNGACRFNLGRMPMGANDYSLEWYSYDETPEDTALVHFSIERDRQHLIPYLQAARTLNPQLRLWASPWCPPTWMKTNRHYAGAPAPVNDLRPDQAGQEMVTQFRMEPAVLDAYARYFGRFLDAYRDAGIEIYAVHVQNEPNSCQNFPSCVWRPEDLATFIGQYLGPRFADEHRRTEIWLGTVERPHLERVEAILTSPAGRFLRGVGFQWAGKGAVPEVHRLHPDLPLMQTETECGDGSNDWAAAEHTWELMQHYFDHGARAYMYWNLVLDETGNSRWGWRQNAMITVDRATRRVRFNPEFHLLQHFSHFIVPGARSLALPRAGLPALAFRNPDGEIVLVVANPSAAPRVIAVQCDGRWLQAACPSHSFSTLVLPASR